MRMAVVSDRAIHDEAGRRTTSKRCVQELRVFVDRGKAKLRVLVLRRGAAVHHRASVRITPTNEGRTWAAVMEAAGVDFATLDA